MIHPDVLCNRRIALARAVRMLERRFHRPLLILIGAPEGLLRPLNPVDVDVGIRPQLAHFATWRSTVMSTAARPLLVC